MPKIGTGPRRPKPSVRLASVAALLVMGAGDPDRGLAVVTRQSSTCVLCHAGPWPNPHLQGSIGPDLHGVGRRLSTDALQARIAVGNPDGVMPSFGAVGGARVGAAWTGRPILSSAEIEDAVAYLSTLRSP